MEQQALISMEEYNLLLKVKKDYDNLMEGLKDKENVILVDFRRNHCYPYRTTWYDSQTPSVFCGEKLAKDYLQKEFDMLFEELKKSKEAIIEQENIIREQKKKLNKKWWQ